MSTNIFQSSFLYTASGTPNPTQAQAFQTPTSAGSLLIVVVGWEQGSTITSLTSSGGNTYIALPLIVGATTHQTQAFYCLSAVGGNETVTVNFSGSGAIFIEVIVAEYPFVVSGLSQHAEAVGNSSIPSASITTTALNSIIVNYADGGGSFTWTSVDGFVLRIPAGRTSLQDQIAGSGLVTGTFNTGSGSWECGIAAFPIANPVAGFTPTQHIDV